MTQYLDKAGLTRYDELIKLYIGDAMNTAVTEAIQELAGALKFKGLVGQNGDVTMHTDYPNAEKGDVYFVSPTKVQGLPTTVNITYYDGPGDLHDTEQMESGDALICLYGKKDVPTSGDASTYPRWGVLNVNWNAIDGSSTLSWGQTTTLATIGGVTIDAALPAKSSISPADIGAATAAQGALAATAYQKPSGGIPKADLASAVQTSLGKADNALQQDDVVIYDEANSVYKVGNEVVLISSDLGNPMSGGATLQLVNTSVQQVQSAMGVIEGKIPDLASSSNQLADKAFVANNYKPKQTAATINPTASGTGISFITTISQTVDGVVSATKQSVRLANDSQSGLMTSELFTKLGGVEDEATADWVISIPDVESLFDMPSISTIYISRAANGGTYQNGEKYRSFGESGSNCTVLVLLSEAVSGATTATLVGAGSNPIALTSSNGSLFTTTSATCAITNNSGPTPVAKTLALVIGDDELVCKFVVYLSSLAPGVSDNLEAG